MAVPALDTRNRLAILAVPLYGSGSWPFLGADLGTALSIVREAFGRRAESLENVLFRNAEALLGRVGAGVAA